jgi:hypothetical protein
MNNPLTFILSPWGEEIRGSEKSDHLFRALQNRGLISKPIKIIIG